MSSDYDKIHLARLLSKESWKKVARHKNKHAESRRRRKKQGEYEQHE